MREPIAIQSFIPLRIGGSHATVIHLYLQMTILFGSHGMTDFVHLLIIFVTRIFRYATSPGELPAGWAFYTFWQYSGNTSPNPGDADLFIPTIVDYFTDIRLKIPLNVSI